MSDSPHDAKPRSGHWSLSPADGLVALTRLSVERPRAMLLACLLVAAAGIAAASGLEVKTSNLDLIDSRLQPVADFRRFAHEFGTPNALVVVLRGHDRAALERAADELLPPLRRVPGVQRVMARLPISAEVAQRAGIDPYFRSRDGGLLFLFVQPADAESQAALLAPFASAVRRTLAAADLPRRGIEVGFTGLPQYALDDQNVIQRDLSRLTILSFVAILALFLAGFSSLRRPLLAMAALSLAMVAVLGAAAVWPGHLTLLSAFFASILLGLGVDQGIHLVDRVEELEAEGLAEREALVVAMRSLAPGLFTGVITTALAFFSLLLSGFRGFAELGWIAGLGLLVCLLATVTALPALLVLVPRRRRRQADEAPRAGRRLGALLHRLQHPALALVLVIACLVAPLLGRPRFDADYLALQPRGSEAARLEREMVQRSQWSPQFAVFVADDFYAAERLAGRLYHEPLVGQVRGAADFDLLAALETDPARLREIAALRSGFISHSGRYAVYAYPQENVWDPARQLAFVRRMQAIDPHVTGMPILGRFMVDRSRQAMLLAGGASALLLIVCVFLDFRRPGWAGLALLPTALAAPALLGAMRAFGVDFNPIAVMALPVVLGTAEDYGVHLVHRYREERGDLRRVLVGTGRGVLLTGATTVAGFGSLCLATHRGLASFGATLALGVGLSLLLSLLVLPSALAWLGPRLLAGEAADGDLQVGATAEGATAEAATRLAAASRAAAAGLEQAR